jgi:hypothetical protein
LKTGVQKWKGFQSLLNTSYETFLSALNVRAFPARPKTPEDKGKVEKKIRDIFACLDLDHRVFDSLEQLQQCCNDFLNRKEQTWRSGATGLPVNVSYVYEKRCLKPLPETFPPIPDAVSHNLVRLDSLVSFLNNYYQVPIEYVHKAVECLLYQGDIIIRYQGHELGRFVHLPESKGMVRLSTTVFDNEDLFMNEESKRWALEVAHDQEQYYLDIIAPGATQSTTHEGKPPLPVRNEQPQSSQ